jgi:hypothetical protein
MSMPDALQKFPMEMGFALFEYRGDGKFLPIAELPEWISEIWAEAGNGSGPISFSAQSPFLENFLFEAEEFWNSPGSAACQSETWIEKSISGREIPVQARALFLGGKRILALFSPVSQFREQAKILQTARNAWLDHERLAREIQKKEILLHCIVHDLSQPLSVMHVAMESLSQESISERSKQFLTLGRQASDQQETMIRQVLQTFSDDLRSSLDAGMEGNSSCDLLECARKTTTALGPTFEAKGVRLALSSLVDLEAKWPVTAEDSRLQRIFSNLLENALRYTPAGGGVTVGVDDEGDFLGLRGRRRPAFRRIASRTDFRPFHEREAEWRESRSGPLFLPDYGRALGRQHWLRDAPGERLAILVSPSSSDRQHRYTRVTRDASSLTSTKRKSAPVRPLRILPCR